MPRIGIAVLPSGSVVSPPPSRRPVGYGVDTFQMVDMRMGGKFRAPHNSYLEVLVELGFLGLLLFIRMYVLSWRALQKCA